MENFKKELDKITTPEEWKTSVMEEIENKNRRGKVPMLATAAAAAVVVLAGAMLVNGALSKQSGNNPLVAQESQTNQENPAGMTTDEISDQTNQGQTSGQTNGQPSRQTNEQPSGQTNEQSSGQTNDQSSGQTNDQSSGQTNEQPSGQTNEQPSGQTNEQSSGQAAQESTNPAKTHSYHASLEDLGEEGAVGGAGYEAIDSLEGYEEGGPEEYPVKNVIFQEGAVKQSGPVNLYTYERLLDESSLINTIGNYYGTSLISSGMCSAETVAGGYDNYTGEINSGNQDHSSAMVETKNLTSVNVSCNAYSGKFCLSNCYTEEYLISLLDTFADYELEECKDTMYKAAKDFADSFSYITGDLTLANTQEYEFGFLVDNPNGAGYWQISLTGYTFYFESEYSKISLAAQDGLTLKSRCLDSGIVDPNTQYFTVTVIPDGNIYFANNYITKAEITDRGTMDMFDQELDSEHLLEYITSIVPDDTMVISNVELTSYNNYFGNLDIDAIVTVEYYVEGDPDLKQSTEFVLYGLK